VTYDVNVSEVIYYFGSQVMNDKCTFNIVLCMTLLLALFPFSHYLEAARNENHVPPATNVNQFTNTEVILCMNFLYHAHIVNTTFLSYLTYT
jgi:hypothetical protein